MIVHLSGELDMATWKQFSKRLRHLVNNGYLAAVLLDLSALQFIDAHSVGLIVHAEADARVHGRLMRVFGLRGTSALVFKTLGLDYLVVRPSREVERFRDARKRRTVRRPL